VPVPVPEAGIAGAAGRSPERPTSPGQRRRRVGAPVQELTGRILTEPWSVAELSTALQSVSGGDAPGR
jgi:hypothetical protein